jgi:tetratricopeptide (TPR) repeat protein
VLYGRKEDGAKAVENFEEALRRKPKDLGTRSNLANAYQSRGWFDLAETEYKRVLHVADGHIEAHLGLGETYMPLAEAGDPDFYPKAIECFETALGLGSKRRGSKLLGDREIAAIHFYLGVAKSKLLEKGAAEKGDILLKSAFQSFEACHQKDPENYQAARAKDKIKSELCDPAPRLRRLAESYGAVLILLPCLTALLLIQTSFFFKWPVRHLIRATMRRSALVC